MIVNFLVGENQPVKVSFRCDGQQMDYVQDAQGIRGTINGTGFHIDRTVEGEVAPLSGRHSGWALDYTSTRSQDRLNIKGLAGTVQYSHDLFPGEAGSGIHSDMQGKFG